MPKTVALTPKSLEFLQSCLQLDSNKRSWESISDHEYLQKESYDILGNCQSIDVVEITEVEDQRIRTIYEIRPSGSVKTKRNVTR